MDDRWSSKNVDFDMDPRFLNRIIGKTIKITMHYGTFQGVLINVDPGRAVLLSKVKELGAKKTVPGVQVFFGPDIINVELQRGDETSSEDSEEESKNMPVDKASRNQTVEDKANPAKPPQEPLIAVLDDVKSEVEKEEVEYTVIDQFQPLFGSAIGDIKNQNVLSVSAVGQNLCRHGKLSWIQVASKSHIYLFDIFLLGPKVFKNGLQMILEDQTILKVIHDCRCLSDCLSHQYGIKLSNVFDTQVADVFLFYMNNGGFLPHRTYTVDECLTKYLNIPPQRVSVLKHKQKLMMDDTKVWLMRPMPAPLLKLLALEVAHLQSLRLAMSDAMMADFTFLVDGYINVYRQKAEDLLGRSELSGSELPDELRQLSTLHITRREKALREFCVNDQGLLIRNGDQQKTQETNWGEKEKKKLQSDFKSSSSKFNKLPSPFQKPNSAHSQKNSHGGEEHHAVEKKQFKLPVVSSANASGQTSNSLRQSFKAFPRYPHNAGIGFPVPSRRGVGLSVQERPGQSQVPFLPPICPVGSRIRMSAPQLLAKTLNKSDSETEY